MINQALPLGLTSPALWAGISLLFIFITYRLTLKAHVQYPPGPRPDPLIGHIRAFPVEHPEKTFREWGNKHGDIVYVQALGKSIIILNSLAASRDLLEKRSAIYSGRPPFVFFNELAGWDDMLSNMQYGDRFRKHRRLIQEFFNPRASLTYQSLQEVYTDIFLQDMLKTPHTFIKNVKRLAAGLIMKITYDHEVSSGDDFFVRLAEQAVSSSFEVSDLGSMLVEFIPMLKFIPTWMPGAGFRRHALHLKEEMNKFTTFPFEMAKKNMNRGTANSSFVSTMLENHAKEGEVSAEDEKDIKGAAGMLYAASADTTATVIVTFILAMVLYPNVYRKLQEEIDRVVGSDRLPRLNDADSLPYLKCVLKEVYRWNTPTPLGVPHNNLVEDTYRGYYIPKNSTVIANLWAIMQDPVTYPEPHVFRPERFMDVKPGTRDTIDPTEVVFGFGRRVCLGKNFAEANVWLAAANITSTFNISKARDTNGEEITPIPLFSSGVSSHPKPFQCSIRPRSDKVVELIQQSQPQFSNVKR